MMFLLIITSMKISRRLTSSKANMNTISRKLKNRKHSKTRKNSLMKDLFPFHLSKLGQSIREIIYKLGYSPKKTYKKVVAIESSSNIKQICLKILVCFVPASLLQNQFNFNAINKA